MTEWQAYESLEPMGNVEPTHMAASICAVVVNVVQALFRDKGSQLKHLSPEDFIPKWGVSRQEQEDGEPTPQKAQTVEEMKAVFQQFVRSKAHKGKGML